MSQCRSGACSGAQVALTACCHPVLFQCQRAPQLTPLRLHLSCVQPCHPSGLVSYGYRHTGSNGKR
jgi:hypothetical protein